MRGKHFLPLLELSAKAPGIQEGNLKSECTTPPINCGQYSEMTSDSESTGEGLHFMLLTSDAVSAEDQQLKIPVSLEKLNDPKLRFFCATCDFSCRNKRILKSHVLKHSSKKKTKTCQQCGYITLNANDFKKHLRIHTGEKPYKCPYCDYRAVVMQHIRKHIPKHTGFKPFFCTECNYRCSDSAVLKTHLMTHTDIKPFVCPHCGYRCRQSGALKKHIRTHTGDRPHSCPHCDYKATQAGHVKVHMRRIHPTVL
uniref:C2H2-type domain-containing protein n=2 Tax=Lygus hesperus TaxID=30085 RepID=A0A0A9WK10_LYGHE